jgi:hypothetical protein
VGQGPLRALLVLLGATLQVSAWSRGWWHHKQAACVFNLAVALIVRQLMLSYRCGFSILFERSVMVVTQQARACNVLVALLQLSTTPHAHAVHYTTHATSVATAATTTQVQRSPTVCSAYQGTHVVTAQHCLWHVQQAAMHQAMLLLVHHVLQALFAVTLALRHRFANQHLIAHTTATTAHCKEHQIASVRHGIQCKSSCQLALIQPQL